MMDWGEAKARLDALRPWLSKRGMAPATDAVGAALQRVKELEREALLNRQAAEKHYAFGEAQKERVEELEGRNLGLIASEQKVRDQLDVHRTLLANEVSLRNAAETKVRRLEGLIAAIAQDALGDDAPINRGLNSVQAVLRHFMPEGSWTEDRLAERIREREAR